jgi:hypothetical protein
MAILEYTHVIEAVRSQLLVEQSPCDFIFLFLPFQNTNGTKLHPEFCFQTTGIQKLTGAGTLESSGNPTDTFNF